MSLPKLIIIGIGLLFLVIPFNFTNAGQIIIQSSQGTEVITTPDRPDSSSGKDEKWNLVSPANSSRNKRDNVLRQSPGEDGHTSIGDSPPAESNKKGKGNNLSPGPQNVTGEFFKRIIEDYGSLPAIQVNHKYSGQLIKSTGVIQDLEYLQRKNVSKIVILVHSEVIDTPGFKQALERLESHKRFNESHKRKGPTDIKRGPNDIYEDKYFVVIEYPGSETALNFKKGDVISFQGSLKDITGTVRPNPDLTPSGKKFMIKFNPIF